MGVSVVWYVVLVCYDVIFCCVGVYVGWCLLVVIVCVCC